MRPRSGHGKRSRLLQSVAVHLRIGRGIGGGIAAGSAVTRRLCSS